MKFETSLHFLTAIVGIGFLSLSHAAGEPDSLFQSDNVLQVRLTVPLSTLVDERPFETELPASFEITDGVDAGKTFDVQVRTRGRFRRREDVCRFPPLRLNFRKSATSDTVLDKQDKLKLVTHCMTSVRFEQTVLKEYAAYRILNELTDASFRVRLLRITYVDSENQASDVTRLAFVIEHRDRLAKRLDVDVLDLAKTTVDALDSEHTNLVSLFHYLIGNTDFSPIQGVPNEPCCHNHVLLGSEGVPILSIPYDFDQSGLVSASYAQPNPRFRLRNVRQRLYRGRCLNNQLVSTTLATYRGKHEAIATMLDAIPELDKRTRRTLTGYVGEFFDRFKTDKRVKSTFIDDCV